MVGGLDARLDRVVPSEPPSAFLLVNHGDHPGRVYPLGRNTVVIGRDHGCDIALQDDSVSARHARVLNGALGFEVEDLESTNGTFVDDQPVVRARLAHGQRLRIGAVELTFLRDRQSATQPVKTAVLFPTVVNGRRARAQTPRPAPARDEDEGISLEQLLAAVARVGSALRKNGVALAIGFGVLTVIAAATAVVLPAGSSAYAEVRLHPRPKNNPVEPWSREGRQDDEVQFFSGAERAFSNPALVEKTLATLGAAPTPDEVDGVAGQLKFEPIGEHLYLASYKEGPFARPTHDVVGLLEAHIGHYIKSETDKTLAVFVKEVDFLRAQTGAVERELARIDAEVQRFKSQNADYLPEAAAGTLSSRAQMEARRLELKALIQRLEGEIGSTREQVSAAAPLAQSRMEASQNYRSAIAEINRKLAEKRAEGLAEGHPEVRKLLEEKRLTESLIEREVTAQSSVFEQKSNSAFQGLQVSLRSLQTQVSAARTELAELDQAVRHARRVVSDMPVVDARLQELTHTQDSNRKLHAQLFDRLKKAEVQLELERVSVTSRFELVTAPRLDKPRKLKVFGTRLAIAWFVGLLLAAMLVGYREIRPKLREAWAAAAAHPRVHL